MNILSLVSSIGSTVLVINIFCISLRHGAIFHNTGETKTRSNHVAGEDKDKSVPSLEHVVQRDRELGRDSRNSSDGVNDNLKRTTIRFLTKTKLGHSDENLENEINIAANDFHIIELEPETEHHSSYDSQYGAENVQKNSPTGTLRIHLMKKAPVIDPGFRVVVRNGEEEEEWSPPSQFLGNCHYVGRVTSVDEQVPRPNADVIDGLAIFSACPPSNGFTGMIILEDGRQWYIEPVQNTKKSSRTRRDASLRYRSMEHVLVPHSEFVGLAASHLSDVLRVPLPELEEAARLAAIDAEARSNMRHVQSNIRPSWDDSDQSFEALQVESSIFTPFFYSGASLPFIGRGGEPYYRANQARKLAGPRKSPPSSSAQTTLLTPLDKGGRSTTTTSRSTSAIPAARVESPDPPPKPQSRVVEIAVFTDEEMYDKMKSKFNKDTTEQLKAYATALINMMDVMYQHASLGVDIRFRLVYLEVMKGKPTGLKTNGGRAKAYLSSFCEYAGDKNANSGQWDHALLLTGMDLHEEGIKTTAGLAWAGTMCFRYYSCSISEGLNFASAYITTHEIGHSLGMEHDGVGISESCDSTKYIMSPTTGPGKVTWSSCSSDNLRDFIKYGTSELRQKAKRNNMISKPICLDELSASSRNKKSFGGDSESSESDLKLPGEKYDANFQCSLGANGFAKPHFERRKAPFDNICWILYCGNGTHAISTHPALEGTPCDKKKHCRAGQCVPRPV